MYSIGQQTAILIQKTISLQEALENFVFPDEIKTKLMNIFSGLAVDSRNK